MGPSSANNCQVSLFFFSFNTEYIQNTEKTPGLEKHGKKRPASVTDQGIDEEHVG